MVSQLRLILFGPPGAGKGTQAGLLKTQLDVEHISSGDLFRYHLQTGTALGLQVSEYMKSGLLVPDELTIQIILDKVSTLPSHKGFILDGFPRTEDQAKALDAKLTDLSISIDAVICINVIEAELMKRLSNRYVCTNCQTPHSATSDESVLRCNQCNGKLYQRDDDTLEAVQQRIQVYQKQTYPVINFYQNKHILHNVSGLDNVEQVNADILNVLSQLSNIPTCSSQVSERRVE